MENISNPSSTSARKVRADSQRNRLRLIEAAKFLLAQGGEDISLEAVARQANVGIGTLYRHFPNRLALFETLFEDNLAAVCNSAKDLLAVMPPSEALRNWLGSLIDSVASNRGMRTALSIAFEPNEPLYVKSIEMLTEAADTLLDAAAKADLLNQRFEGNSLIHIIIALCSMRKVQNWQAASREACDIFVTGLLKPEATHHTHKAA